MFSTRRAAVAVALLLLGFGYGVATVHWKVFPYGWVRAGFRTAAGWQETLRDAVWPPLPHKFIGFDPAAPARPAVRRAAAARGADDGLILISGGPYQLAEHCPDFGCLAWLVDRDGRIAHVWEVDWATLWADTTGLTPRGGPITALNIYPIGMHLFDNGDLVVTYQAFGTQPFAVGIVRVDRNGRVLWKRLDYSHHWPTADPQGRIYVPALRVADSPYRIGATAAQLACKRGVYEDVVRVLSGDGAVLREYPIAALLVQAGRAGLVYGTPDPCDPTHLNAVALAGPEAAARVDGVAPGDLLVSLRGPNAIAVLDRDSGAVKHLAVGRTIAQNGLGFLPDGGVLVVDNLGGAQAQGGTRIARIDLASGTVRTVYPPPGVELAEPFFTKGAGQLDISQDGGRALIAVANQGRIVELDLASGSVTWEYVNAHDIGRFLDRAGIVSRLLRPILPGPKATAGRFNAEGAYYAGRPSFLD